jgi:LysR family glycine cleavage system transcriptional activator
MWLRAAGARGIDHTRGQHFSHSSVALQMAIGGQGVSLGSNSLTSDDLKAGRLVRLFDVALPVNFAYYLTYPEETAESPKIIAFRDWILSQAIAAPPAA